MSPDGLVLRVVERPDGGWEVGADGDKPTGLLFDSWAEAAQSLRDFLAKHVPCLVIVEGTGFRREFAIDVWPSVSFLFWKPEGPHDGAA